MADAARLSVPDLAKPVDWTVIVATVALFLAVIAMGIAVVETNAKKKK